VLLESKKEFSSNHLDFQTLCSDVVAAGSPWLVAAAQLLAL